MIRTNEIRYRFRTVEQDIAGAAWTEEAWCIQQKWLGFSLVKWLRYGQGFPQVEWRAIDRVKSGGRDPDLQADAMLSGVRT